MSSITLNRKRKHGPPEMQWYKCVYCGMPEYMHFEKNRHEKCIVKVRWRVEPCKENGYAQPWLCKD